MDRRIGVALGAVAVLAGGAVAGAAVASPGSGDVVQSTPVVGLLDGSGEHPRLKVRQDGVRLDLDVETRVASFRLTYPPGAFSGWHAHPGIVVVVVQAGEVERRTPCTVETFSVGEAFTEVGAHHVSNPSATVPAVLEITRVYPADATQARIDLPVPDCP
ncbi:hypothetical protein [Cellulomonas endophytica]|uniref:hypothetical protein n=1 Tax=Cellulomonas endophytica TaxID=2494735 RepID=UPI0010105E6A|nr:hypothetical protein [Cellulomonas endophytica]